MDIKFAINFNTNTVKPWLTGGAHCQNNGNLLLLWRHIIKDKPLYEAISTRLKLRERDVYKYNITSLYRIIYKHAYRDCYFISFLYNIKTNCHYIAY